MRDVDEFGPAAPACRRVAVADAALLVDRALGRRCRDWCAAIRVSLVLSFCAAWKAAPPSMIAMRLPTGELHGSEWQRIRPHNADQSGSICSTSPTTVPTSVSWPCPDEVV